MKRYTIEMALRNDVGVEWDAVGHIRGESEEVARRTAIEDMTKQGWTRHKVATNSPEAKAKRKATNSRPDVIEKRKKAREGIWTKEKKKKLSDLLLVVLNTKEVQKHRKEIAEQTWKDNGIRTKRSNGIRLAHARPEVIEKRKLVISDPEYKRLFREACLRGWEVRRANQKKREEENALL